MTTRIALAALAVLLTPATVAAQGPPGTVEDVLRRFAGEDFETLYRAGNDAGSLLRQVHGPVTAAEIAALIEGLVEIALAPGAYGHGPRQAGSALRHAAWRPGVYVDGWGYLSDLPDSPDSLRLRGVPVPEAFDALVRIYETLAARALADGGDDPFLEAARRDHKRRRPDGRWTTFEESRLRRSLSNVFHAGLAPDGRGWRYALALFERSRPPCKERDGTPEPPDCTVGPGSGWCAAGKLLHEETLGGARPWPGPDQDLWKRRCSGSSPWNRFWDWR